MSKKYYVYIYLDPILRESFYVGKGSGKRDTELKKHSKEVNKRVAWIRAQGFEPIIQRIKKNMTEDDAYSLEEKLVADIGRLCIGRGPLLNFHPGGRNGSKNYEGVTSSPNARPIMLFHPDGKTIEEFPSIAAAARKYNLDAAHLQATCTRERKNVGGRFRAMYLEDFFEWKDSIND